MKKLEEFILEKLNVSKIEKKTPKTKEELVKIMIEEIKENGPDCSLNHIDVSNITDMSFLFRGGNAYRCLEGHPVLSNFNGDISGWDVSNVTDMRFMFNECKYNGKNGDISNWDVSNVTSMDAMFSGSKFNGDISDWDVSSLKNMYHIFNNSPLENNPPKWYK